MGVLEARADAEKIGYPVVGEKIKDADNVIDYDIREEITKDVSAEINANNQTTTGMATVIPGINAPKLIESTSIISTPVPGYVYTGFRFSGSGQGDTTFTLYPYVSDQIGSPNFIRTGPNNRFLKVPSDGVYKLNVFFGGGTSRYGIRYFFYSDEKGQIDNPYPGSDGEDKEYTLQFKKGEVLSMTATVYKYDSSWTGYAYPAASGDITRLG